MKCLASVDNPSSPLGQKEKGSYLKHQSEFAALCSFIHHFGDDLGVHLTFPQLLEFLTITDGVHRRKWETIHVKLLNKLKYRARSARWEPVLGRFLLLHGGNVDGLADAAAILQESLPDVPGTAAAKNDRYYDLDALTRTKVLLSLLESQFDRNQSFKEKVNNRSPLELRFQPLGTDVWGQVYWLLKDSEVNILMYREDPEHQNIRLICETTDEIRALYNTLKDVCSDDLKLSSILANCPLNNRLNTVQPTDPLTPCGESNPLKQEQSGSLAPNCTENPISPLFVAPSSPATDQWDPSKPCKTEEPTLTVTSSEAPVDGSEPISPHESDKVATSNMSRTVDEDVKVATTRPIEAISMFTTNSVNSEPAVEAPYVDTPTISEALKVKRRKRGRKSRTTDCVNDADSPQLEVRRSGRQRKPVKFLTMEPLQPKRPRSTSVVGGPKDSCSDTKSTHKRRRSKKKLLNNEECLGQNKTSTDNMKLEKKTRRKRHRKSANSRINPWAMQTSSSETDDDDDAFELALLEQQDCCDGSDVEKPQLPLGYCTDWLDKPESDFNPDDLNADSDVDSLIQGRNFARQKRLQQKLTTLTADPVAAELDEPCQICMKCDTPEWILLCDRCDLGYHAMCLCPPLFFIPEGDWFCPRCQHSSLVTTLSQCADSLDAEQKKQTIWKRMQERLNYVNISMTNIIAAEDDMEKDEVETNDVTRRKRNRASVAYRESGSSGEYTADSSLSSASSSHSDSEKWFGRRGNRWQRSRRSAALGHVTRPSRANCRNDRSPSESEDTSSEEHLPFVARTTRKREAHYDMSSAFRLLDEALEGDEKYQEERRLRKSRKANELDGYDDKHEIALDTEALPVRHRSAALESTSRESEIGKLRSRAQRQHRTGRISTSLSDSSEAKSKASNNDVDFHPSSDSASSQLDASETEEDEFSDSTSSDKSWLCVSRYTRRGSKKGKSNVRRNLSFRGAFKSRRLVPRFEASVSENSDSEEYKRTRGLSRRRTRTVIKYNESEDGNSDHSDKMESEHLHCPDSVAYETHNPKNLNEDSDAEHTVPAPRSSKSLGRRMNRRVLSSDSDYHPDDLRNRGTNDCVVVTNVSVTPGNEPSDSGKGASPGKQRVDETVTSLIPSESVVSRVPHYGGYRQPSTNFSHKASSDEESVEEEAESLLPVRPPVPTDPSLFDTLPRAPQSPDLFDGS